LSELNLEKIKKGSEQYLKPKFLLRYAPGNMRKETSGRKLDHLDAFSMDRLSNNKNFETGLSSTIGFDYSRKKNNKNFDFSIAQIINEKENKNLHDKSSMDEKLSDLVGAANYTFNENLSLTYDFNVDQNYSELNYNEIGTTFDFNPVKFKVNYLQKQKHLGEKDFIETDIEYQRGDSGVFAFKNKRDLIKNSWEYYDLSYEYLNDCLRAGIVYRREFYNDSELEPENSLMFKITLTPFANINAPLFKQ